MAYIIVSATSEQVGPGWTRTGITANLTGRQFPTRRVRPPDVPDAHEHTQGRPDCTVVVP